MKSQPFTALLAVGQILLLASCGAPVVKELTEPLTSGPIVKALLHPTKLRPETRADLEERGLHATYRKDPDAAIRALWTGPDMSNRQRATLVELCLDTGEQLAASDPMKALGYHLAAAELAFPAALVDAERPAESRTMLAAYNFSSGRVAKILFDEGQGWDRPVACAGPVRSYRILPRTSGPGFINPQFFDELQGAEFLEFKGVDLERKRRPGIGAAMVGHRDGTPEHLRENPFLPSSGMSLPVNVTLDFARAGDGVELGVHDLLVRDDVTLRGSSLPLAADMTTSLAFLYDFETVRGLGFKGMLHPEEYTKAMGLYQVEPYRPDKIPVVMIHGLMSSPETWLTALDALRADPVVRKRYQLLVFEYPTGYPVTVNAAALRGKLKEFQEHYDPGRRNPNMREMVLVGHSMGGLLTSSQIRSSGDTMTRRMFTCPIDELKGIDEKQRAFCKEVFEYEANPDITRAIFVAAPHRGSGIAQGPIGRLGRRLIRIPSLLLAPSTVPEIEGLTDFGRQSLMDHPDGIRSLEPNAPGLMAVLDQPVRRGMPYHSIIGNHGMKEPLSESSDTVVPYWSSHLDGATSTKIVDAKHTTITHDPVAIGEIRRILYLHAGLTPSKR